MKLHWHIKLSVVDQDDNSVIFIVFHLPYSVMVNLNTSNRKHDNSIVYILFLFSVYVPLLSAWI